MSRGLAVPYSAFPGALFALVSPLNGSQVLHAWCCAPVCCLNFVFVSRYACPAEDGANTCCHEGRQLGPTRCHDTPGCSWRVGSCQVDDSCSLCNECLAAFDEAANAVLDSHTTASGNLQKSGADLLDMACRNLVGVADCNSIDWEFWFRGTVWTFLACAAAYTSLPSKPSQSP